MHQRIQSMLILLILTTVAIPLSCFADEIPSPAASNGDGYTVRGYLWNDTNCDGLRDTDAAPMTTGGQSMSLFYIGTDGVPFTPDDSEVGLGGAADGWPTYLFSAGGENNTYYIAIRPSDRPAGVVPSPWQQGSDRTIDNDLRLWPDGAWATGTFVIPWGTGFFNGPDAVSGIDIGMCSIASIPRPYQANLPLVTR